MSTAPSFEDPLPQAVAAAAASAPAGAAAGGADAGGGVAAAPADPPLARSAHPTVCIFHLLFKSAALLTYILGTLLFSSSFVILFVSIILLLAFDFWTTKNISGRLLVGLRWWNEVHDTSTPGKPGATTNKWRFESSTTKKSNDFDVRVFWGGIYASTGVWILMALSAMLQLKVQWLLLCAVALVLNGANLVGYIRCDRDAKAKMQRMARTYMASAAVAAVQEGLVGGAK